MALSRTARSRLTKLIDYMAGLNVKGHFKMRHWAAHKGRAATIHVHGVADVGKVDKKHLLECGMTACAAGWACTIPSFQRAGLMMKAGKFEDHNLRPVFDGEEHFAAIMKFFDINEPKARRLFGYTRTVATPAAWAKDARKVLAQWTEAD